MTTHYANNLSLDLHNYICNRLKHNITITIFQKLALLKLKIMFHRIANTKSLK